MAQIKEIALTDLRPDPQNVNLGTEPGSAAHEASIRHNGLGRSILATADNVILAGNKTYEQAGQLGAAKRVVAVDVEGDTLVVVRRTDLKSGTPEATAMALADNRTSQLNYAPDEALLASLLSDLPTVEAAAYRETDLDALLEAVHYGSRAPADPANDPAEEWRGMPEYEHEDKTDEAAFVLRVFLRDEEDLAAFGRLLGRDLTGRKFVWFSKQPQGETYEVR